MTEEQVELLICEHLNQVGSTATIEDLQRDLNQKTVPQGWVVKIKKVGNGVSCHVNPVQQTAQPSHTPAVEKKNTSTNNGVTCCKCGVFNPYLDTPSQPDGTHICYSCRLVM